MDEKEFKSHNKTRSGLMNEISMYSFTPDADAVAAALNDPEQVKQGGIGDNSVQPNSAMPGRGPEFFGSRGPLPGGC